MSPSSSQPLDQAAKPTSATSVLAHLALLALLGSLGVAAFYNGPATEIPLLLWSSLGLVVAVALALRGAHWPESVTQRRLIAGCFLYLLWLLVSWRLSVSPAVSLAPLWALASTPLALLAVLLLPLPPQRMLLAAGAVLWMAVVLGVVDLLPDGRGGDIALLDENNLATLANVLWPPALVLGLARHRSGHRVWLVRAALVAVLGASTALLMLSSSRGGVLIAALLAAPLLVLILRLRAWPVLACVLGGVLLGGLVALAPGYGTDGGVTAVLDVQDYGGGVSVRAVLIGAALDIWQQAPLTGTGPQTFHLLYGMQRSPDDAFSAGLFATNDYVQFLQEGGPVQAGLLVALTVWLAWNWLSSFLRLLRDVPRDGDWLRLACASGAGGMLAHALFQTCLYVLPLALALGVLSGVAARCAVVDAPGPAPSPWPRRGLMVGVALFVAFALPPLAIDAVSASVLMGHPGLPGADAWRSSALGQQQAARSLLPVTPDDGVPPLVLGLMAQQVARGAPNDSVRRDARSLAAYYFEMSLDRDATNFDTWRRYAALAGEAGGRLAFAGLPPRTELELLREAQRLRPQDLVTLLVFQQRLQAAGLADERRRLLLHHWLPHCRYTARLDHVRSAQLLDLARALGEAGTPAQAALRRCDIAVRVARQRLGLGADADGQNGGAGT